MTLVDAVGTLPIPIAPDCKTLRSSLPVVDGVDPCPSPSPRIERRFACPAPSPPMYMRFACPAPSPVMYGRFAIGVIVTEFARNEDRRDVGRMDVVRWRPETGINDREVVRRFMHPGGVAGPGNGSGQGSGKRLGSEADPNGYPGKKGDGTSEVPVATEGEVVAVRTKDCEGGKGGCPVFPMAGAMEFGQITGMPDNHAINGAVGHQGFQQGCLQWCGEDIDAGAPAAMQSRRACVLVRGSEAATEVAQGRDQQCAVTEESEAHHEDVSWFG